MKPTYGLVSRRGVFPLSTSLDHVGPMTRCVRDNALLLQVIAGHDEQDPASAEVAVPDYTADLEAGVKGLKIAVIRHFYHRGHAGPCRAGAGDRDRGGPVAQPWSPRVGNKACPARTTTPPARASSSAARHLPFTGVG